MLKILIVKEVKSSIQNFKFLISIILGVVIIPLLIIMAYGSYKNKQESSIESRSFYLNQTKDNGIGGGTEFRGFRPQSSLSIFTVGVEDLLPDNVTIKPNTQYVFQKEWDITNLLSSLFGNFDFLFCISYIYSLLAFTFSFNAISGEKEDGTLKLIFSNAVTKWEFILSKILSNYIIIVLPLIIGILISIIGLIILGFDYSGEVLIRSLLVFLLTFVFLFVLSNIGILISSYSNTSSKAILQLLILWVVIILVVPKMSTVVARLVYPIESISKVNREKELVKKDMLSELDNIKRSAMEKFMSENNLQMEDIFMQRPSWVAVRSRYEEQVSPYIVKYQKLLDDQLAKIDDNFYLKVNRQVKIALYISKISPISSYVGLTSDICNTGYNELLNYRNNSQVFQDQANREIYSLFKYSTYVAYGNSWNNQELKDYSVDISKLESPSFVYKEERLSTIFSRNWVDFAILMFWGLLSFGFTYKRFLDYDIR